MYTKEETAKLNQIGRQQRKAFEEIAYYVDLTSKDYFYYKELAEIILPLAEQILRLESQAEVIEVLRQMRDKDERIDNTRQEKAKEILRN